MAHGKSNLVTLPKLYAIADRSCFAEASELYRFVGPVTGTRTRELRWDSASFRARGLASA